ncbi:MAG: NADH:ubiquinone oxidoreductase subunit 1 [Phycisphaerales bacterium]|nr:NADH:ubiquinone oxidoreductase subunit 1 [Phycisphaerales bacterium]
MTTLLADIPVLDYLRAPWIWIALGAFAVSMSMVAYLILLERKVAAWAQDRVGPNRVGLGFGLSFAPKFHFWGLGQPAADGLKFFLKEDFRPSGVDKVLFTLAPMIMIFTVLISICVIPWGGTKIFLNKVDVTAAKQAGVADAEIVKQAVAGVEAKKDWFTSVLQTPPAPVNDGGPEVSGARYGDQWVVVVPTGWKFQVADVSIGVLFVLSTLSLAVYGVVIGGWASNNKYSFLGGLRACANMISYEIPLGLSILIVVLMFGTLDMSRIVEDQARYWYAFGFLPIPAWNVFAQPLAFVMFLICIHAEANRAPFDLAEAEQELVGGYHTEYSSMRFALFFLSEYAGMITTSCVCVALFFGGWHLPGLNKVVVAITGHGVVSMSNPAWSDTLVLNIARMLVFFTKAVFVLFLFMWVRWSLPRFRFDQLMRLAWGGLIPISLALLLISAVLVWWTGGATYTHWNADGTVVSRMDGWTAIKFLIMNAVVLVGLFIIVGIRGPAASTNRRVVVPGSRFKNVPLPQT